MFGDSEDEQDMRQDATDDNSKWTPSCAQKHVYNIVSSEELAALARETEELKAIKAAMGTPEYAKKVFDKVNT